MRASDAKPGSVVNIPDISRRMLYEVMLSNACRVRVRPLAADGSRTSPINISPGTPVSAAEGKPRKKGA